MKMKPYYQDLGAELYNMDFRKNELPDESVQCVVTSPPYWGLRKYSGEQELIWGDDHCEHQWIEHHDIAEGYTGTLRWVHGDTGRAYQKDGQSHAKNRRDNPEAWSKDIRKYGFCSLCGAWKGAYGLEPTPEMYVQHTIEILREIRRVLRKDGVVFWNIGDSYGGTKQGNTESIKNPNVVTQDFTKSTTGTSIKPKDLCLIPFRIAIVAQEDGWWVRSVIIWSKPNPMPESVTDRPTESHEYILMLTKSARYYWDADAVREPHLPQSLERVKHDWDGQRPEMSSWSGMDIHKMCHPAGRNIRTVWEFPTQPFPAAHFAVFPEKLPELCIKAATPEVGCCSKCGAPWERVTNRQNTGQGIPTNGLENLGKGNDRVALRELSRAGEVAVETLGWQPTCKCNVVTEQMKRAGCDSSGGYQGKDMKEYGGAKAQSPSETKKRILKSMREPKLTTGWQGTCDCGSTRAPSIVLDPFAGAGTTLRVAKKLGRKAIGFDTSEEYCKLAVERNRQQALDFLEIKRG